MSHITNKGWAVVQVDRDFWTGSYAEGTGFYLYTNTNNHYIIISGVSYDENTHILRVNDIATDEIIEITTEPYFCIFEERVLKPWRLWGKAKVNKYCNEDAPDYEPWYVKSKKSLAKILKILPLNDNETGHDMYYRITEYDLREWTFKDMQAAAVIQAAFRKARYNPKYQLCKTIVEKQKKELYPDSDSE